MQKGEHADKLLKRRNALAKSITGELVRSLPAGATPHPQDLMLLDRVTDTNAFCTFGPNVRRAG